MRDYELMIILDPNLDDAAIEALTTRIGTLVTQRGGSQPELEAWGRRRLAYPIKHNRDGHYVLFRFQLPPTAAAEIERALRLMEAVIRHLLVRSEELEPAAVARA